MPNPITLNKIIRLNTYCQSADRTQLGVNVSWWRCSNVTGTPTTDQEAAVYMENNLHAAYKALMAAGAQWYGLQLQIFWPLPAYIPVNSVALRGAGTVAGDQLPTQIAGLFTLKTQIAAKYGRGRKYIPFPGEADSDANGLPSAGYQGRLQTLATLYIQAKTITNTATTGTVTLLPVLFHRKDKTWTDIDDFFPRSAWGNQRRRSELGRADALPF